MTVTILVDNSINEKLDLQTEHGLSIYFEIDNYRWLYDVGATNAFYNNAQKLGIQIDLIDFLIISHGHYDHIGGLGIFLEKNKKARIFMSRYIYRAQFFSHRHQIPKKISIDSKILDQNIERITWLEESMELSDHVSIITQIQNIYFTPKANYLLYKDEQPDDFKHEIALAIETPKGLIVFSGCSHNGILNILQACYNYKKRPIYACIGGTHLIDSNSFYEFETKEEIRKIAQSMRKNFPDMFFFSGHYNGKQAHQIFNETLKEKYNKFYTGLSIKL